MKKKIKVVHLRWKKWSGVGLFSKGEFQSSENVINEWVEKNNIDVDDIISIQYPNENAYETGSTITITYKVTVS